jgi:hypothetical protein
LGRDAGGRDDRFVPFAPDLFGAAPRVEAEAPRAEDEAGRGEADARTRFGAALRDFGAVLRARVTVLRAARAFGRAVRRRAFDLPALWRDFRCRAAAPFARRRVLRPAFRVPAFALRFAITNVLSA